MSILWIKIIIKPQIEIKIIVFIIVQYTKIAICIKKIKRKYDSLQINMMKIHSNEITHRCISIGKSGFPHRSANRDLGATWPRTSLSQGRSTRLWPSSGKFFLWFLSQTKVFRPTAPKLASLPRRHEARIGRRPENFGNFNLKRV